MDIREILDIYGDSLWKKDGVFDVSIGEEGGKPVIVVTVDCLVRTGADIPHQLGDTDDAVDVVVRRPVCIEAAST